MSEDDRNIGYYTPQEYYTIHVNFMTYIIISNLFKQCIDLDPNSITKELEDISQIEKYKISEDDYNKIPGFL